VHHLQGKAERVKSDDLLAVLREFHHEKLLMRQRHVAVARHVTDYDFNNAYQYVIAREDVHLQWLEAAILDLEGTADDLPEPSLPPRGKHDSFVPLVREDAREAGLFVDRWRARVDGVSHARHRGMMSVILGETLEHRRFFEQIVGGQHDVLGRRANGPGLSGTTGRVLPVRWMS
jgi:hypothetical protein